MPLNTGLWRINANGTHGILEITTSPGSDGAVTATLFETPCRGFWSEREQKLTLIIKDGNGFRVFTGYKFGEQGGPRVYLAGTFEAFKSSGSTARRNSFGWRAVLG